MSRFRLQFSCNCSWVKKLFDASQHVKSRTGLRLLQAPAFLLPASETVHGKLLIVVPRRYGTACQRNLIRRQIKSLVYEHSILPPNTVHLLIISPRAQDLSFQQLHLALVQIFRPHTTPNA